MGEQTAKLQLVAALDALVADDSGAVGGVTASTDDEWLDRLAARLLSRLEARGVESLLPKQDVTGSNPITRSTRPGVLASGG